MQLKADDYTDIGLYLRDARESLRMDINVAAKHLNIRARYLNALEEGKLSELPGATYIRGYLKNYAELLRLDKEEVLAAFEKVADPQRGPAFYYPEPTRKENRPTPKLLLLSAGLVVLLYVAWYFIIHSSSSEVKTISPLPANLAQLIAPKAPPSILQIKDPSEPACFVQEAAAYPPCYLQVLQSHPFLRELDLTPTP